MANSPVIDAYLNTNLDARPSNYGVTHLSWPAVNNIINWSELRVIRNVLGHPQNINDGTQIYSASSDAVVLTVSATYKSNPVKTFTYKGGGTVPLKNSDGGFLYYTNVAATGGTGTGATFDVVRSAADNGNVISVTLRNGGENFTASDTLTLSSTVIGVDSSGTSSANASDVTITVSAVGNASAGVKTFTVTQPGKTYTNNAKTYGDPSAKITTFEAGVAGVTTGTATGKDATFKVVRDSAGVYTVTLVTSGTSYKVGDIIRIPGSLLEGTPDTTILGRTANYHIFDTGLSSAVTTNPGSNVGTLIYKPHYVDEVPVAYPKYYYSLFVKYTVDSSTVPQWSKVSEASTVVVSDGSATDIKGNVIRQSTLNNLLNHLPEFYVRDSNGVSNTDLKNFLALFAFHIDMYLALNNIVFNMVDVNTIDEVLIKPFLKELGASYADVNNLAQARKLLENLVRNYKLSGSSTGLADYVEAYSGYATTVVDGRNLMLSYNDSSFVESTGAWYPDPDSLAYNTTTFASLVTFDAPIAGTAATYLNTSGVKLTSVKSNGTLFTCADTTGLVQGAGLTRTAGTGAFAPGTVVTAVLNGTQFKTNLAPTTAFSGATVYSSTNLIGGMLKVTGNGAGDVSIHCGFKKVLTYDVTPVNNTTVVVYPDLVSVGEYLIGPGIPYETKVVSKAQVGLSGITLTLSKAITAEIASTTQLVSAPAPIADMAGAATALIPVSENKPYTFSVKTHANGGTAKDGTASITWYDVSGNVISTASNTVSSATNTNWETRFVSAVSPAGATYAEPSIKVISLDTNSYWLSAAQFDGALKVTTASASGTTVTLNTDTPHNYNTSSKVSVSGLGTNYDGTFAISSATTDTTTGNYNIQYTNPSAVTNTSNVVGYMSSVNSNFEDSRVTNILPTANRVNYVPNPSFEVNTTGWSTYGSGGSIARVQPTGTRAPLYGGSYVVSVTSPSSATGIEYTSHSATSSTYPPIVINAGDYYSFSAWLYLVSGSNSGEKFQIIVRWYNGTTLISSIPSATVQPTTEVTLYPEGSTSPSGWKPISFTLAAPSAATRANFIVARTSTGGSPPNFYMDSVMVEKSYSYDSAKNYYFDGSYDGQNYTSDRDSLWEGTAHLSASHLYKNRVFTSGKLDSLVTDAVYYA